MASFARATWLPLLIAVLIAAWAAAERSPARRGGAVVLRWVVNSQERDLQFARAARAAFEAGHPGIRVEFIKSNEGRKEETMIAGGDAPDILRFGLDRAHYYVTA